MFTPNENVRVKTDSQKTEIIALVAAVFFIAFGLGLITDGKKLYSHQLKVSERIDFKATQNPYQ